MDESQIRALIRKEIKEALAPILMGSLISNQGNTRVTMQRMPTEGPIGNLRNIQPYGVSSRAPEGMDILTVPIASDPTHLNMVGVYDKNKPTSNDGETILYDAYGHIVYLSETKMQFGSEESANPMVLGDILKQFCDAVCNAILNAPQLGWCAAGGVWLDPDVRTAISNAQEEFVDTASTNFISQKAFTER